MTIIRSSPSARAAWQARDLLLWVRKGDPTAGGFMLDRSPYHVNGTSQNMGVRNTVSGPTYDFVAASDAYLSPPSTLQLMDPNAPFSICWHSQLDSFAQSFPGICQIRGTGVIQPYEVFMANGGSYGDVSFGGSATWQPSRITLPGGVAATDPHWGVVTYNGLGSSTRANYSCYINGVGLSVVASGGFGSVSGVNRIGDLAFGGANFDGAIWDFRVYGREFTAREALLYYHHWEDLEDSEDIWIFPGDAPPPGGDVAPLHYHHRHHNLAG